MRQRHRKIKLKFVLAHSLFKEVVDRELRPHARVVIAQTRHAFERHAQDADALITLVTTPVTENLISRCPRLKVVSNVAVGVNNIDLKACYRHGVAVVNTPDVLTRTTAELTLALLLAAARRIPEGEALCRSGKFRGWAPDLLLGLELRGRQATVVGPGRIGKETAELFRGIGLKTQFITRRDSVQDIARKLACSQVLSLHIPYTQENHHWLSRQRLSLLPPDAIVLNASRGPIVDEKALIESLKNRHIFSAGLDVYEHEPEIPADLRSLPNVVLLPHLGSATTQARYAMAKLAIQGALVVCAGLTPPNRVVKK